MKYVTYEEPFKGKSFSKEDLMKLYEEIVNKTEYPDFECWFDDMIRSGVLEKEEEKMKDYRVDVFSTQPYKRREYFDTEKEARSYAETFKGDKTLKVFLLKRIADLNKYDIVEQIM